mmetsp:Transcript_39185/g.98557  ORF Transcript_39185/g.98557 Transcript_39185/m.98557 type:complete len:203 (+) Transcript_39185:1140-1748(+)
MPHIMSNAAPRGRDAAITSATTRRDSSARCKRGTTICLPRSKSGRLHVTARARLAISETRRGCTIHIDIKRPQHMAWLGCGRHPAHGLFAGAATPWYRSVLGPHARTSCTTENWNIWDMQDLRHMARGVSAAACKPRCCRCRRGHRLIRRSHGRRWRRRRGGRGRRRGVLGGAVILLKPSIPHGKGRTNPKRCCNRGLTTTM